jgi:hypothetical protein
VGSLADWPSPPALRSLTLASFAATVALFLAAMAPIFASAKFAILFVATVYGLTGLVRALR